MIAPRSLCSSRKRTDVRETGDGRDRWTSSLTTHSTCEGGDTAGLAQGAATAPTEGRGEQADVSAEGNIGETQNSNGYVHKTSTD